LRGFLVTPGKGRALFLFGAEKYSACLLHGTARIFIAGGFWFMPGIDVFSRSKMRISFAVQAADSWFDGSLPLSHERVVKLLHNVQ